MRVILRDTVYEAVEAFYVAAMSNHPTLDLQTVFNKEDRLYRSLQSLGDTYYLYGESRYVIEWKRKGYHDYLCEDFHFAFQRSVLPSGEEVISVEDSRHSLLFHD